jgi:hypothetical protein
MTQDELERLWFGVQHPTYRGIEEAAARKHTAVCSATRLCLVDDRKRTYG